MPQHFDDVVGLTNHDVAIDDFPLVAVVTGGTFRVDAVPAFEKTRSGHQKSSPNSYLSLKG